METLKENIIHSMNGREGKTLTPPGFRQEHGFHHPADRMTFFFQLSCSIWYFQLSTGDTMLEWFSRLLCWVNWNHDGCTLYPQRPSFLLPLLITPLSSLSSPRLCLILQNDIWLLFLRLWENDPNPPSLSITLLLLQVTSLQVLKKNPETLHQQACVSRHFSSVWQLKCSIRLTVTPLEKEHSSRPESVYLEKCIWLVYLLTRDQAVGALASLTCSYLARKKLGGEKCHLLPHYLTANHTCADTYMSQSLNLTCLHMLVLSGPVIHHWR